MTPKFIVCLAIVLSGNCFFVRADEPTPAQLETEQRELCVLLVKASPNSFNTNPPALSQSGNDFSPYLTKSENNRLAELLRSPEITKAVTREQALAAVKQRQLDDSLPGFQYNAMMDLVNQRWPHDAAVIAFYSEALAIRGEVAISDLFSPLPGIWDDSLLEPVIHMMEKNASTAALVYKEDAPKQVSWVVIDNALAVLDRHYSVWATNASIPPRLSAVVLTMFPSLTNAILLGPRPGNQMWCNAVRMLSETHDPTMIAVLRPYLKDKAMAGDGGYWMVKDNPPVRACDRAAIAIKQLVGEKGFAHEAIGMPGLPYWNVRDSYPKWDEWDGKIAELQKQLDALGSALHFIRTNHVDTAQHKMTTPEAVQRISTEGESAWRVSWSPKIPDGAAAIKGGQLVIMVHDSGKIEKVFSE
jgi:hypothetical protein